MIVIGSFRQYSLAVNGTLTVASESAGGFIVNQRDNLTKQIRLVSASYTGATQDAYVKFYRNQGKFLVTKKMEWDEINAYWYYDLRAEETALYGTMGVSFELTEAGQIDVILSSTMLTFEINKSGVVVVDDGVSSYSGIDTDTLDISIDNNNNTITADVLDSPKLGGISASLYALKSELPDAPLDYQGTWDADTNTPDISGTTTTGYFWIVSVAGLTDLGGITDWKLHDWAVKTATGWSKVDNSELVTSVNGATGTVELDAEDIPFDNTGTNLLATTTQSALVEIDALIGNIGEALDIINGEVV